MIGRIKHAWTALLNVIWPQKVVCLMCDEPSYGQWMCPECVQDLAALRIHDQKGPVRCMWRYKGVSRELIHALKYDVLYPAAEVMASDMAEEARRMNLPSNTLLTYVTTTRKRIRIRGGDHGRNLCAAVARELNMPMRKLLVRVRNVRTQRGLNRQQRQVNIARVFSCPEEIDVPVLVIDDVYTTGATTRECARALTEAGAPAVYVLAATRVTREKILTRKV